MPTEIAAGLCRCGCGEPTRIARQSIARLGHVKGQPIPFVNGAHARRLRPRSLADRFWAKVEKSDGCWLWRGAISGSGYGTIWQGGTVGLRAHRVSWELHNGPIPAGQGVLHRCDTPACVNPSHLFLGSHLENMRDMYGKGRRRHPVGERNGNARLTAEDVARIRRGDASPEQLARDLGITRDHVMELRRGRGWRHIQPEAVA